MVATFLSKYDKHVKNYDNYPSFSYFFMKYLADRVAMYKHAYTLYSAVRPFGCSVALGSYDEVDGPQLFMVDPSGVSFVCYYFFFIHPM